ncbi:MAG TPA: hypothetical protein VJ550_01180 [Geomonas sp.]|nr:hypothetical protein [Geomonas sp.]
MKRSMVHAVTACLFCLFPLLLLACSSGVMVRQHADFKSRTEKAKISLLLPPQVVIQLQTSNGNTRKSDEEAKVIKDINTRVAAELTKRGYKVLTEPYQGEINDKLESATTVKDLTQRLSDKVYQRFLPEGEALSYKFSLGAEAASLAQPAGASSLLFTKCKMMKRSSGSNAAESGGKLLLGIATLGILAPPKNASGYLILQATLVDAATGDVLWGNQIDDVSYNPVGEPAYQDQIEDLVADLFKSFPQQ